jgi:O-acetyl-ADP-ribose deacetylase (regulator of RNase III)
MVHATVREHTLLSPSGGISMSPESQPRFSITSRKNQCRLPSTKPSGILGKLSPVVSTVKTVDHAGIKTMAMITDLKGDATQPQAKGNRIIAHIGNDLGGWGQGFVLAISKRWAGPEAAYRSWHKQRSQNDFGLGAVQLVPVEPYIWIANMVAQRGRKTGSHGPPIRYEAVRTGLKKLAVEAKKLEASVHMPRIGCGLAGGKWEEIEPIIADELGSQGVEVTVYDFV